MFCFTCVEWWNCEQFLLLLLLLLIKGQRWRLESNRERARPSAKLVVRSQAQQWVGDEAHSGRRRMGRVQPSERKLGVVARSWRLCLQEERFEASRGADRDRLSRRRHQDTHIWSWIYDSRLRWHLGRAQQRGSARVRSNTNSSTHSARNRKLHYTPTFAFTCFSLENAYMYIFFVYHFFC